MKTPGWVSDLWLRLRVKWDYWVRIFQAAHALSTGRVLTIHPTIVRAREVEIAIGSFRFDCRQSDAGKPFISTCAVTMDGVPSHVQKLQLLVNAQDSIPIIKLDLIPGQLPGVTATFESGSPTGGGS